MNVLTDALLTAVEKFEKIYKDFEKRDKGSKSSNGRAKKAK